MIGTADDLGMVNIVANDTSMHCEVSVTFTKHFIESFYVIVDSIPMQFSLKSCCHRINGEKRFIMIRLLGTFTNVSAPKF